MKKSKSTKSNKSTKPQTVPKKTKRLETQSSSLKSGLAAVEAMPNTPSKATKLSIVVKLLFRPEGATLADLIEATGWQAHTVRGALSGALGKKRGYQIVSDKPQDGQRIFKIAEPSRSDH
ncbi:MAG: DUF3489 domain-containing protein [Alphaproteobacteria bacterium]|nr:DUF3489 domain-containing protein [Alphaproteobacteria bacterium]